MNLTPVSFQATLSALLMCPSPWWKNQADTRKRAVSVHFLLVSALYPHTFPLTQPPIFTPRDICTSYTYVAAEYGHCVIRGEMRQYMHLVSDPICHKHERIGRV